ncbi:hypothetical protein QZH41_019289, partial [Actinostola sp. cb2023]
STRAPHTAAISVMSTVVINPDFSELLKQSTQKQNDFFAGYKDQFKTVPIVSGDENVELGDHICVHRALFTHHFICTGCNDDKIVLRTTRISQSKKPCKRQSLEVKDREYTYQQLEEKHAYRMQWPRKLASRFNISQVIKRAKSRDGESSYDLLKNNCQHFVTWCKCGLNASVQVEEWVVIVRTTFYTLVAAAKHSTIDGIILVLSNISDDVACLLTSSQSFQCSAVGIVLEVLWALYQTYLTFYLWKKDVIKTDQFHTDIAEIWAKGACRAIGGVAGSIIGAAFGPIGSLVGGAIGAGVGHFVVTFFEWFVEDTQIRERVMTVHETIQAWNRNATTLEDNGLVYPHQTTKSKTYTPVPRRRERTIWMDDNLQHTDKEKTYGFIDGYKNRNATTLENNGLGRPHHTTKSKTYTPVPRRRERTIWMDDNLQHTAKEKTYGFLDGYNNRNATTLENNGLEYLHHTTTTKSNTTVSRYRDSERRKWMEGNTTALGNTGLGYLHPTITPKSKTYTPVSRYRDSERRKWVEGNTTALENNGWEHSTKCKEELKTSRSPLLQTSSPSNYTVNRGHYNKTSTSPSFGPSTNTLPRKQPWNAHRVIKVPRRVSERQWRELEQKLKNEQREFLEKYMKEGRFKDEAVSYAERNVRRVDFCVFYLYQQAKRRIWPEELERFDVDEVIRRATKCRKGESWYNVLDNNCEDFVTWCKCGLNVSLQVKPLYRKAWNGAKAVASGALEAVKTLIVKQTTPLLVAAANLSDDLVGLVSSPLSPIGFGVGALIETGLAARSIYKDYQMMKQGIISERQFKVNRANTSAKAASRFTGGVVGATVCSTFGPVGTIVGGALGAGLGHFAGSAVGSAVEWCYEAARKIKKAAITCLNEMKTGVETAWSTVKGRSRALFTRIFSAHKTRFESSRSSPLSSFFFPLSSFLFPLSSFLFPLSMFKIMWPDALRRYDVSDIVKRAKRRNQERIGNSEHLVTWCICGLDVDLQITHLSFYIKDAINTIRIIGKERHKRKLMEALSRALSTQAQSRQDTDDTATVYSQVSLVPSLEWNAIEKKSPFDQRNYLLPFQNKFQVEELSSVAIGDHLVFKRKRLLGCICYYHSALCINVDFDENNQQIIEIIEYTLPDRFAWNMLLGDIPVIKISKKTLKELKDDDAYRMQWPKKLESRFNISQVIKRAKSRDGESSYDLLKNNCQHFVTWCKCGLNASVQVEEWVVIVRTTFYTLVAAATHSTIDGIILVLSNISDDVACLLTSSQSFQCSAVGIVLEVLWALYQTYLTFYLWKKDVIKTDQFHTDIAEIWAKGACRAIGGVAGSIIGGAFWSHWKLSRWSHWSWRRPFCCYIL